MASWSGDPQRSRNSRPFKREPGNVRKAIDEMAAENLLVRRRARAPFRRHPQRSRAVSFSAACRCGKASSPSARAFVRRAMTAKARGGRRLEIRPARRSIVVEPSAAFSGQWNR